VSANRTKERFRHPVRSLAALRSGTRAELRSHADPARTPSAHAPRPAGPAQTRSTTFFSLRIDRRQKTKGRRELRPAALQKKTAILKLYTATRQAGAAVVPRGTRWSHIAPRLTPQNCSVILSVPISRVLVDPAYIRFDNVRRDLSMGKQRILARLADNSHLRLVEDTVAEMGWWACFREDGAEKTAHAAADSRLNL